MKLTKSQLKQIIREEIQNLIEAEEAWVLERSGVTFAKAFVKKGSSPSDPKFGSLGQAKTFKSKEAAKSFAAKSDIHVSVKSKESLNEARGDAYKRYDNSTRSDAKNTLERLEDQGFNIEAEINSLENLEAIKQAGENFETAKAAVEFMKGVLYK